MEAATPNPGPISRSREIRLGLVMYGGISLAIYINGVAREFYRAVRGESIYKLIKAFTDSDIVVDIVSGTSAGGVNGILLGYALCNRADFATTAELWRKAGDIGALVRDPDKLRDPVLSVLDGEGQYQNELEKAFGRMDSGWQDEGIDPSQLTEMDVFITSTDVDGRIYNWFDAQGHPVNVKDHRAVFHLKFREGRKNDFEHDAAKDRHRALAKLSRMTSCFPVAFPPVRVVVRPKLSEEADSKYWAQWEKPDTMIAGWGALPMGGSNSERQQCDEMIDGPTKKTKSDYYFLDGGVLDNKPFTYTTREIFYRLADRAIERKLFYVEPDPEQFNFNASATQVNALQAVQRALISIPGYESIADDLKLITARNEKIYRYQRLIGRYGDHAGLQSAAERVRGAIDEETQNLIDRIQALEKGDKPKEAVGAPSRYARARFITLSERAVRGVLKSNEQEPKLDQDAKTAAENLYRMFDEWNDPADPNGDLTLYNFDVYFRIRRMFHVLYACPDPGMEATPSDKLRGQVLRAIGSQISLLEIIQAAMEKLVDDGEFCWRGNDAEKVWGQLMAGYQTLLSAGEGDALLPPGYTDSWSKDASREDQPVLAMVYQRLFGSKDSGKQNELGRIAPLLDQLKSNSRIEKPKTFVSVFTLTDACERRMLQYFDKIAGKLPDHAELPRLEKTYDDFLLIVVFLIISPRFSKNDSPHWVGDFSDCGL